MSELFVNGLSLTVVGVCAVFSALIVTGLVVTLIGRVNKVKPPKPAAEAGPLPEEAFGGIDRHVIVLLAAAATVAVKRPVRIRRVRFVSHKHIPSYWYATGRAHQVEGTL